MPREWLGRFDNIRLAGKRSSKGGFHPGTDLTLLLLKISEGLNDGLEALQHYLNHRLEALRCLVSVPPRLIALPDAVNQSHRRDERSYGAEYD